MRLFLASLLVSGSACAELPKEISDAFEALRRRGTYRWAAITEESGAFHKVSRLVGQTDGKDTWLHDLEACVSRRMARDRLEFQVGQGPLDELGRMTEDMEVVSSSGEAVFTGKLSRLDAAGILISLAKLHSSSLGYRPSATNGFLEIWIKNKHLQKYRVTTSGAILLPFGTRGQKAVTTVWIDPP